MHRLEGYKVSKPVYTATSLDSEGWTLGAPVPGFEVRKTVRRPMAPGVARTAAPGGSAVGATVEHNATMVQAVFSDGLTHISVFIEPFVASLHKREVPATLGSTSALSRRNGDWWITAVGAVPVAALQQFVQGLERRSHADLHLHLPEGRHGEALQKHLALRWVAQERRILTPHNRHVPICGLHLIRAAEGRLALHTIDPEGQPARHAPRRHGNDTTRLIDVRVVI